MHPPWPPKPSPAGDGPWQGFPPVWHSRCRVLVLGTFPGPRSLAEEAYYAHPRNAFWDVIGAFTHCNLGPLPYRERLERLLARDIALWDVLARCRRDGSEDARIVDPEPNDFGAFLPRMPGLRAILFNGQPAFVLWRRMVARALPFPPPASQVLPSTSPAAARLPRAEKIRLWVEALGSWTG